MENEHLGLIIESLLFAAEKPISPREIHMWLPEQDIDDIKKALNSLVEYYESLGRSFTLKEVAGAFQLRTRSDYAPHIQRMLKGSPTKLSRPALETLSIIAYKQPVLRQEIERLRGVDVGGILRTLLEKDLIRVMGRKNLPGKPLIYGTTRRFLEIFDLKNLESLPKLKEIKGFGLDEEKTDETAAGGSFRQDSREQGTPPVPGDGRDRDSEDPSHGHGNSGTSEEETGKAPSIPQDPPDGADEEPS